MLNQLLEVEPSPLRNIDSVQFINQSRIIGEQLQNYGQVIEFFKVIDSRRIELGIVYTESERWLIIHASDTIVK